jgi:hypothetical protein
LHTGELALREAMELSGDRLCDGDDDDDDNGELKLSKYSCVCNWVAGEERSIYQKKGPNMANSFMFFK